ncbi:MAG: biotin--[acetyl-CoA-carboxylase] ligase, partial [Acidimicrobiia bacterium]|nr:biotin--[acetyl-CoA-carboxylase] ligase [Acidimicrobiia bacterium]
MARAEFDGAPVHVVAARQTRGRGRSGSAWETAPRAVATSLALDPGWAPEHLPLLPAIAALAVADVWVDVQIKWPNDILLEGEKVAGILAETADGVTVVGVGANLWWPDSPPGRAARFAEDPGPDAAAAFAEAWAANFLSRVAIGPDAWGADDYRSRSWLVGRAVEWEPNGSGIALGIADDGALLVEVDGTEQRLLSGEVRVVRPVEPSG